jgi:hypothetical protein
LQEFPPLGTVPEGIGLFATARRLFCHPTTISPDLWDTIWELKKVLGGRCLTRAAYFQISLQIKLSCHLPIMPHYLMTKGIINRLVFFCLEKDIFCAVSLGTCRR